MNSIKHLSTTLMLVLITSCSGGGGGSGSVGSSITGLDFSGTYTLVNVQCTNSSITTITNATTFSGVANDTLTVNGNSYTGSTTFGACSTTYEGNVVVTNSGLSLSNRRIVTATGGSCNQTLNLNGTAITPTSTTSTVSSNQSQTNLTNIPYLWNPSTLAFGLLSIYTDGTSGGYCFIVYQKQ